jgi:hypothetical protein
MLLNSLWQSGSRLGIISNTGGLTTRAEILNLLPTDFDPDAFKRNGALRQLRSLPGGRYLTQRQHARVANRQTLRHVCHDAIRAIVAAQSGGSGLNTHAKCRGIQLRFLGRPSRRPEDSVHEESLVARVLPD